MSSSSSFRVLALDLDGTLLSSDQRILPDTHAALRAAQAQGLEIILVTGRQHIMVYPYHVELALSTPVVCCNGAYLYDFQQHRVLDSDPLDKSSALQLIEQGRRCGLDMVLYCDDKMVAERFDARMLDLKAWAQTVPEAYRPDLHLSTRGFEAEVDDAQQIWKLVMSHPDLACISRYVDAVSASLPVSCEWSWQNRVDVTRVGNSKGKRLAALLQQRGIAASEVIAFGDHLNDLSMLTSVGMGIAMGNAELAVRACVRYVTTSNDDNGIALALRQWVLAPV